MKRYFFFFGFLSLLVTNAHAGNTASLQSPLENPCDVNLSGGNPDNLDLAQLGYATYLLKSSVPSFSAAYDGAGYAYTQEDAQKEIGYVDINGDGLFSKSDYAILKNYLDDASKPVAERRPSICDVSCPLKATCSLTASPKSFTAPGTKVVLTLTTSGSVAASNFEGGPTLPASGGTKVVYPAGPTVYKASAVPKPGGASEPCSVKVEQYKLASPCKLTSAPSTNYPGQYDLFVETDAQFTSYQLKDSFGTTTNVNAELFSQRVSPTKTTQYTVTLRQVAESESGKDVVCDPTTITIAPHSCSISAAPEGVLSGQSTTLTMTISGATSATLNGANFTPAEVRAGKKTVQVTPTPASSRYYGDASRDGSPAAKCSVSVGTGRQWKAPVGAYSLVLQDKELRYYNAANGDAFVTLNLKGGRIVTGKCNVKDAGGCSIPYVASASGTGVVSSDVERISIQAVPLLDAEGKMSCVSSWADSGKVCDNYSPVNKSSICTISDPSKITLSVGPVFSPRASCD